MEAAAGIDRDAFRRTCAQFATGIAVASVTGRDGSPFGLTVNSFTSVSCCPPLVLICIDYRCTILSEFRASSYYAVNVLSEDQLQTSVHFSESQGDRFDGIDWFRGTTGVPLLAGCAATFECCVSQVVEAGDHAILIAEVVSAACRNVNPLLYFGSSYRRLAGEGK
jgi:flavin reductase (DIM6/NTAB) family NADH-FMN oxidoreductase RutF